MTSQNIRDAYGIEVEVCVVAGRTVLFPV